MIIALLLLAVWAGIHWLYPSSAPVGLSDSEEVNSFVAGLKEKEKKLIRYIHRKEKPVLYYSLSTRIQPIRLH